MKAKIKEMFRLTTQKIAGMAVLSALAIVLALILHVPIFPAVSFLEYDMADIPIFLGTFMYGPFAGMIMTVVVAIIQGVTVSAGGSWIGIVMHIFATGLYVLVAGTIYYFHRNIKGALIGMASGIVAWIVGMILWNILLTPIYMGVPKQMVIDLLGYIVAFNAIKVVGNTVATVLLYKRLRHLFDFVAKKTRESIERRQQNKTTASEASLGDAEQNAMQDISSEGAKEGSEEEKE